MRLYRNAFQLFVYVCTCCDRLEVVESIIVPPIFLINSNTADCIISTTPYYQQARSQKFAMGGAVWGVWGRSPQPPEANGGLGAKPPAAGGWGFGGKTPSRRRHGGLREEPPVLEKFAFFCKNNFIFGLF